jgi:DNA helicase II / ATP-dependent DNA helicase PcrA
MAQSWTPEQQTIIDRPLGSTVVVAAPGSGKTSVLTEHVAKVVRQDRVAPNRLMAITFTRQAAEHMRTKLRRHPAMSFKAVESLRIGTFHAQFFRALLEAHADIPVLLNEREQRVVMREAMERTQSSRHPLSHRAVTQYLTTYSRMVGTQQPSQIRQERATYAKYQSLKRSKNRWDYDDILLAALRHFQKQDILPFFRHLQYLLVDEFQDTNRLQWLLIETLHRSTKMPVFVVGDDDQSVYGFRGANPTYLQEAPQSLSQASTHMLTHNFRSDYHVISHAEALIRRVKQRVDKPLHPVSRSPGMVQAYCLNDELSQTKCVLDIVTHLESYLSASVTTLTVGILARTRRQLYPLWKAIAPALHGGDQSVDRVVSVELRTCHDSKGREWDVVILLDVIESHVDLRPGLTAREAMDEERRLFYVSMTRAKHVFVGFIPNRINGQLMQQSRFIYESKLSPIRWHDSELDRIYEALQKNNS